MQGCARNGCSSRVIFPGKLFPSNWEKNSVARRHFSGRVRGLEYWQRQRWCGHGVCSQAEAPRRCIFSRRTALLSLSSRFRKEMRAFPGRFLPIARFYGSETFSTFFREFIPGDESRYLCAASDVARETETRAARWYPTGERIFRQNGRQRRFGIFRSMPLRRTSETRYVTHFRPTICPATRQPVR